jgi:LysM repeat protein
MLGQRYGVSVRDLMGWNGLTSSNIQPGQRLRLTAPANYDARAAARARAAAAAPRSVTHRVQRGENLTQIARQYGVSLSDIRRWNDLSRDTIIPGQRLKIEQPRRGVRG